MKKCKFILGATIGNCIHVAGVMHFLSLAEEEGYRTKFLGAAISIDTLFADIQVLKPDIIAISYRLTPENVILLLDEVNVRRKELTFHNEWVFGGTKLVADIARKYGFFTFISDGYDDFNDAIRYFRKRKKVSDLKNYDSNFLDRIKNTYPYPLIRHHYGRPSLQETIEGIHEISEAMILDVISLGTDQNAQQFFFKPNLMHEEFTGAGGVPVRSEDDFRALKNASKCGNFPLMRCYSGTEDVFQYAKMLRDTIDNAWTAIPLSWYNELDGRGTRTLEESMIEAQRLIKWHALRNIPVEINEPHHWGLRDAHDVIPVLMAYLSAYNAKKLGVRYYISQYMFNNPNGLSFSMDIAKVLAMVEMVESLKDDNFNIYKETRTGLALLSVDKDVAKGQLAASTFMQMLIKPHIIHVVGYCEADHAAKAKDVIESCRIVKGVIRHTLKDEFLIEGNSIINERKNELVREVKVLLDFIKCEYSNFEDPLSNVTVLCDCIKKGYIDAVHIFKNGKFTGNLKTKIIDGKCLAVDGKSGMAFSEKERLMKLKERNERDFVKDVENM